MKKGTYEIVKRIAGEPYGIYKGTGTKPYYAGKLQKSGEPATCGPGLWCGNWFKHLFRAQDYAEKCDKIGCQ